MPSLCVVSGNMQTLSGGGLPQGTVTFQLMNLAIGTIPQVTGTALLPQTQYRVQTALDGSFTVNLWGNDNIVPSTTFYGVTFRDVSGNELGPILFYLSGASQNLNTLASISGGALALVNPIINGTPTGTGIQTITLKKGSGAGNYTTSGTSYVAVDAANLILTTVIPLGWKLLVQASGAFTQNTAAPGIGIGIFDNFPSAVIVEQTIAPAGISTAASFSIATVITGDGNTHAVELVYKTTNGSDAAVIQNGSATATPTMIFILTPSN